MDTDDQDYWKDLEFQGALLHKRLKDLFESGPVKLLTQPLSIPNTPEAKLAQYLHLLQTKHPLFLKAKTPFQKLKRDKAIAAFCIKPENFPNRFFEARKERDQRLGLGRRVFSHSRYEQLVHAIMTDQQKRLKQWVKHLNSKEANYPIWFRFYVLSNIVKLKEFDTANQTFPRRSNSNTANFPELNIKVISDIYRHITEPDFVATNSADRALKYLKIQDRDKIEDIPSPDSNFARLYEFWTKEYLTEVMLAAKSRTNGVWKTFAQDSSSTYVAQALSGHNTGWCTANIGQAADQLHKGDIYIYFTGDENGDFVVPRVLIRMEDERVKEVRGRLPSQEIEPDFIEITNERLELLSGGTRYFRLVDDMNRLTEVINRAQKGERLTREDLIFIYEIEHLILGFGTKADPRIAELLSTRNRAEDLAYIFGSTPEKVALDIKQLNLDTEVIAFDIDRKTGIPNQEFKSVFAVVGDANLIRVGATFPNLTFVSGDFRTNSSHEQISIVRGRFDFTNGNGDFPNLIVIGQSAMLSSSKSRFPNLESIGGSLFATYASISVPSLKKIGLEARLDGAKIDFFNDELVVGKGIHGPIPPSKTAFDHFAISRDRL